MIPFIIASAFTCEDANELIIKMRTYRTTEEHKTEMIQIVKDNVSELECWDAKAD